MEKRSRGSNIICSIILRLHREDYLVGKGTEILGKKIILLRNKGGEEYQIAGTSYTPAGF